MSRQTADQESFEAFLKKRLSLAVQQRLVLLLKREEKQIKQFRVQWHIPENGFGNEKERWDWWNNLGKIAPEKVRDVQYQEVEVYHLFNKFTRAARTLSANEEKYPRLIRIKKNPQAVFDLELSKLQLDLKIDQDFYPIIKDYILHGKVFIESIVNTGIVVSDRIVLVPGIGQLERKISIIIGANTDEQDIRDIYKYFVKGLQQNVSGDLKGKIKNQKEFERNLEIITLHNLGKTAKEIASALTDERIILDEGYIRKIIKRIKAY